MTVSSNTYTNKVLFEISKEEAIVLLDWISRFNKSEHKDSFEDQAEERVLWDIESSLETVVNETFDVNYKKLLSNAREKVRD